jgi:hypothetical protein
VNMCDAESRTTWHATRTVVDHWSLNLSQPSSSPLAKTPNGFKNVLTRTRYGFVDAPHDRMYLDCSAVGPETVEGNRRLVRIY